MELFSFSLIRLLSWYLNDCLVEQRPTCDWRIRIVRSRHFSTQIHRSSIPWSLTSVSSLHRCRTHFDKLRLGRLSIGEVGLASRLPAPATTVRASSGACTIPDAVRGTSCAFRPTHHSVSVGLIAPESHFTSEESTAHKRCRASPGADPTAGQCEAHKTWPCHLVTLPRWHSAPTYDSSKLAVSGRTSHRESQGEANFHYASSPSYTVEGCRFERASRQTLQTFE